MCACWGLVFFGTALRAVPSSADEGAPVAPPARSPHAALSVAPLPDWVASPLDPLRESAPSAGEQTTDLDYLVSERQVLTPRRAAFVQFAYRVTSHAALSDAAELAFTFDPAYETIALHHIRRIRDGRAEDQLALGDFEVIRQERDRERSLYDGRLTAIHQLRDVRVGDIIHYAYTTTGANPVFGAHYVETLSLGWSKPVRQFRYRILRPREESKPAGRFFAVLGPVSWDPERRLLADGQEELRWERAPMAGITADDAQPAWHIAFPVLQLSEFASWAKVVEWALPLYADAGREPHPSLRPEIEKLRALAPDAEARVCAALAFVQEEIRYLGIELGANSHRPSAPEATIERRFGDCKDKTLLLCSLLRALDIEASPALVNSGWGRSIATPLARSAREPGLHASLPTPLAFDHVIARVRLPGGKVFWLDPTRLHQTGPLSQRTAADFGQALVIREGESALSDMSRPAGADGRLHEEITFTSRGVEAPAEMEIRSSYDGDRATAMRAYLSGLTATQLNRDYLNYYLQKYPGLGASEPVAWTDDKKANRIQVRERYSVPGFWTKEAGAWRAEIYPYSISEAVRAPGTQTRQAPLALSHPSETRVDIRVLLHDDWQITPFELVVDDDYLAYKSTTRAAGPREVLLTYHHRSKEDHVPSGAVPAYAANLAKIRADLALSLTNNPGADAPTAPAGFRLNPLSVLIALVTLALGLVVIRRLLRRRRRRSEAPPLPSYATPSLGGWLYLFALGIVVRCITLPVSFFSDISSYFDLTIWENITSATSSARNLPLAVLIVAELVGNLVLLLLVWTSAVLFFLRRREAPLWNSVALVYMALMPALDLLVAPQVGGEATHEEWKNVIQACIAALIWVPYLNVSARVKETFVR